MGCRLGYVAVVGKQGLLRMLSNEVDLRSSLQLTIDQNLCYVGQQVGTEGGNAVATTVLYETDIYAWSQRQVALLRAEEFAEVDWAHVIEEIESLGTSQRSELRNRLLILIMHLLKWQYQPELQSRSWAATITVQRDDLEILLKDNPSLRPRLPEFIEEAYPRAIKRAVSETGLRKSTFPIACPYTPAEILDEEFWPLSS